MFGKSCHYTAVLYGAIMALFLFIIFTPKEAESKSFISAILIIFGRPTKDPEMQQGRNSGANHITLDIGASQRSQDGKEEIIFYQCNFNKFLAERLLKAGVKKNWSDGL